MGLLRRFRDDRSGNVVIIAAGGLAVMLGIGALALDVGSYFHMIRRAQSAADLAALAAAEDLDHADQIAAATVRGNGIRLAAPLSVTHGTYRADPDEAPGERFQANVDGAANAVRVGLRASSTLFFARALGRGDELPVSVSAIATRTAFASFAIGSRLAHLDGGVLNGILGAALGMKLTLSAMDYQALAAATVDLPTFLGAIARRAELAAATYDEVMSATVDGGDVVAALVEAAGGTAESSPAADALATLLAVAQGSGGSLPLGGLVDLGPYGGMPLGQRPAVGVTVSALDLLGAMAAIAGGTHQVALGLQSDLPGIASVSMQLAIGERPPGTSWVTVGAEGASVHTAQTRLLLTIELAGMGGVPALRLPLYLEVASATALLSRLSCGWPDESRSSATLAVTPAVAEAWIGSVPSADFQNFSVAPSPGAAPLVSLPLLSITARAHAAMANAAPQSVEFDHDDIAAATKKTVGTRDFTSLLTSLLGNLRIEVSAAGIGVPVTLDPQVSALIAGGAPAIDTLVGSVLTALGLGIGEADVWLTGIRCDGAVLVN